MLMGPCAYKKNECIFFILAISKDVSPSGDGPEPRIPLNGYSEEFLDRLEPNGNIPSEKDLQYGKFLTSKSRSGIIFLPSRLCLNHYNHIYDKVIEEICIKST